MTSLKSEVEQSQPAQRHGSFVQRTVRAGELPSLMNTHILTGAMDRVGNLPDGNHLYLFRKCHRDVAARGAYWEESLLSWWCSRWARSLECAAAPASGCGSGSRLRAPRLVGVIGAFLLRQAGHPLAFLVSIPGGSLRRLARRQYLFWALVRVALHDYFFRDARHVREGGTAAFPRPSCW